MPPKLKTPEEIGSKDINALSSISFEVINSTDGKTKKGKFCIMTSGWNENNLYFSKEIISQISQRVLQRPKMYFNHVLFAPYGRSVDDWAASIISSSYVEENNLGKIFVEVDFTDNPKTRWIYNELEKDPKSVQVSTHIRGILSDEEEEIEGKKGYRFAFLTDYKSTDFVSYGAAGGYGIAAINSIFKNPEELIKYFYNEKMNEENLLKNLKIGEEKMENQKPDIKTVEDLKKNYPELVNTVINSIQSSSMEESLKEQKEANKVMSEKIEEMKKAQESLNSQIETLKKEKTELAAKVETFELKEKESQKVDKINSLIAEAKMDPKFVTKEFMNSLMLQKTEDDIKAQIKDRMDILSSSSNVINSAGTTPSTAQPGKKEEKGQETVTFSKLSDDDIIKGIKN